jgi:hypothetical protein
MKRRYRHAYNTPKLLPLLILYFQNTKAWMPLQLEPRLPQRQLLTRNAGLQLRPYSSSPFMKEPHQHGFALKFSPLPTFTAPATVVLFQQSSSNQNHDIKNNKKQVAADGTQRGAWLLGAVLLVCLWIFSIPPEFRRAYLCGSERCVQNRSAYLCNNCVTPEEWKRGIIDYYRAGGGVHFDFSVDPNSKMKMF